MNPFPQISLHPLGQEALSQALADVRAPHLPQSQMSDHYAVGNAALCEALHAKVAHLVDALEPQLHPRRLRWPATAPDVLALDLAFVDHPKQPFGLAWVEIQAFTSMLPTFHTLHRAQRAMHRLPDPWLPHDPLPAGRNWLEQLRPWVAPHADTVLIEDHPRQRFTWPDLDAAGHWWGVAVHDWRELVPSYGRLFHPGTAREYRHVWNRLIFSDLSVLDRRQAEGLLMAADRMTWHSHPAWYEGIHKGSLADVALPAHEACHWIEDARQRGGDGLDPAHWVAKAVGGHSGSGLMLAPTREQLSGLPGPRQWIVQNRFRQTPIGVHPATGQPLFGEVRCMLGLRPGHAPWVMAWILRLSTNGIATLTGRHTLPGEGMTLLYFDTNAVTAGEVPVQRFDARVAASA